MSFRSKDGLTGMPTVLADRIDGDVLAPGDPGYDEARTVWNAMVDRHPQVIVRCASTGDVAEAVRFAREHDLEIGVRCGGHSVVGLAVPDGGLMIDLTPMGGVRVDPARRRAWVQGGALLGALDRAAQEHGLATTAGNVSHTGVGGLTLGGGMGWLARRFGLSCDNVEAFELVTAEGELVRASETENPDLFWGLRGGGGNFGIVTEFEFRLHAIGTQALVADFLFDVEDALPVLRGWRDLNADAPRQATFTALVTDAGASVGFVWVGDPAEGQRLIPAFQALGRPAAERIEELSYLDLQRVDDTVEGHALRRYWKGHYFTAFEDEAIHGVPAARHRGWSRRAPPFGLAPGVRRRDRRRPRLRRRLQPARHDVRVRRRRPLVGPGGGRVPDRRGAPLRCRARLVRQRRLRQRAGRRWSRRRRACLPARTSSRA